MLVVVKDRDVHPLAKLPLDVETLRGFDVLEYDAAERGFQRCDNINELFGVGFVDF